MSLSRLKYSDRLLSQFPDAYKEVRDMVSCLKVVVCEWVWFLLRQVPLRYLLGLLFVNFSLVWEPVSELIWYWNETFVLSLCACSVCVYVFACVFVVHMLNKGQMSCSGPSLRKLWGFLLEVRLANHFTASFSHDACI